jgi:hypothetical protein
MRTAETLTLTAGAICGATKLVASKRRPVFFCRQCRRRRRFVLRLLVAEWYDPLPVCKCGTCGWKIEVEFPEEE